MIYGSNGRMGRKLTEAALARGETPILAGRSTGVRLYAAQQNRPCRIFPLLSTADILPYLDHIHTFVDCAGPYHSKSTAILWACLEKKVHYIDITLEYTWSEKVLALSPRFFQQQLFAVSGATSLSLASAYVAASLKRQLPDATSLTLSHTVMRPPMTRGSVRTYLSILAYGKRARVQSRIRSDRRTPLLGLHLHQKEYQLALFVASLDLFAAWMPTRIPSIRAFVCLAVWDLRLLHPILWLARIPFLHPWLEKFLRGVFTSKETQGQELQSSTLARVENSAQEVRSMELELKGHETITTQLICDILSRRNSLLRGAHTPGTLLDFEYLITAHETHMRTVDLGEEETSE
jgi:hypothetical protein